MALVAGLVSIHVNELIHRGKRIMMCPSLAVGKLSPEREFVSLVPADLCTKYMPNSNPATSKRTVLQIIRVYKRKKGLYCYLRVPESQPELAKV